MLQMLKCHLTAMTRLNYSFISLFHIIFPLYVTVKLQPLIIRNDNEWLGNQIIIIGACKLTLPHNKKRDESI